MNCFIKHNKNLPTVRTQVGAAAGGLLHLRELPGRDGARGHALQGVPGARGQVGGTCY